MIDRAAAEISRERDGAVDAAEHRLAELMGVINVAHGALVETVADIIDESLWGGPGYASPAHYLAVKTGMSAARAGDVVRMAERRRELPAVVTALAEGEITLDQVSVIARHVPEGFDQAVTEFARYATVSQLRRALPQYGWEPDPKPEKPAEPERSVAMSTDDRGRWHGRFCLPAEEGAVVERAVRAHRDDLWRQLNEGRANDADPIPVTNADGLLSVAETALQAGEARHPGADRYLVHAHLETSPPSAGEASPSLVASLHWGPVLPDAVRRRLLCDASLVPVLERNGTPINLGRKTRTVSRALRRAVERRDGGCAVPGCGVRVGTEIHHIWHWEDGGPTDTDNLLCLCRRHHQLHHQGLIGIEGHADRPPGQPGAVEVRDRWGHVIVTTRPCVRPPAPTADATARRAGLRPRPYPQRLGDRLDRSAVIFSPNRGP